MRLGLCKSCGNPYDADEIDDGHCLVCQPEGYEILDAAVLALKSEVENAKDDT